MLFRSEGKVIKKRAKFLWIDKKFLKLFETTKFLGVIIDIDFKFGMNLFLMLMLIVQ